MANNKEHVTKSFLTPKGKLTGFISVIQPSTRFNPKGIYTADILISEKAGKELAEEIKAVRTEQFKKYGKGTKVVESTRCVPYTTVNEETGEEIPDSEGRYILKTNKIAYVEDGVPKAKVMVCDSKCKPIKNVAIGEGTEAIISGEFSGYSVAGKTGVSVRLKGIQILNLVEYNGGGSPASMGFTAQEGYEADDFDDETCVNNETQEAPEEEEDF